MCISDIEMVLDFTQTKTSRHLIYLKNAGLVTFRRVDQWTYYAIKEEVADFVEYLYTYLDKDSQLQKDLDTCKILYNNNQLAICKLKNQGDWEFQY